jgi:hypothetical protein
MRAVLAALALLAGTLPAAAAPPLPDFVNHGLVAVARVPPSLHDQAGETLAGFGSAIAFAPGSWARAGDTWRGTLFALPDRGWDKAGTQDYRPRIQVFAVTLVPGKSLDLALTQTILLHEADGTPMTGLDPAGVRPAANGFPDLPVAANGHVSMDNESLVVAPDRSFWIGDEYGPYVYHVAPDGLLLGAIRPPAAFIPMRGGAQSFSSDDPPAGGAHPVPAKPETGRGNNQGFEGLAIAPDGRTIYPLLQSALMQDGGDAAATRQHSRMLAYDIADPAHPRLAGEYVVPLRRYADPRHSAHLQVATANDLLALNGQFFLILAHDHGRGATKSHPASIYRRICVMSIAGATDIAGTRYDGATPVAPGGALAEGVAPARVHEFIDLLDDASLARFGLHNGAPDDGHDLYGKWEGLALAPLHDPRAPDDYFLFVAGDNDFITQHGLIAGRAFADPTGRDVDSVVLVYRVTLPGAQLGGG